MNNFIVRKWQDEVLVIMVKHGKSEIVLVVFPMNRIALEILQSVVHPAHVPFKGKTEATEIWRTSHLRPSGRFLGNSHDTREFSVSYMIEFAQEFDRLKILTAPILIGDPFSVPAGVVQVQHRGNGVYAKAIDVEAVAPEERIGEEEITDFVAAIIEDERSPILMSAFAGVFVFVKGGAIKAGEGPIVPREMSGHPIDDHADASLVKRVDEKLKVLRRAVAAGGCKKACDLVTPGGIE